MEELTINYVRLQPTITNPRSINSIAIYAFVHYSILRISIAQVLLPVVAIFIVNNAHKRVDAFSFFTCQGFFFKAFQGLMPTCKICQCSSTNLTCMDLRKVERRRSLRSIFIREFFRNKMMMLM